MYYHCHPIKYVEYGKVKPPLEDTYEDYELRMYEWLGKYCGYSPQIWLSRSRSNITGYRRNTTLKKRKCSSSKRGLIKIGKDRRSFWI